MRTATFAIPGDIETKTGGYIYERRLLMALREGGRDVRLLRLPASFPDPSPAEMAVAVAALQALPTSEPLIIDGLVFGAIETAGLRRVRAPFVAMIHHPLALETGLAPARATMLAQREADNLALAGHVVVPSAHTARILVDQFRLPEARISIAPPGFDTIVADAIPCARPRILSVGILAPRKGHDILLDALAQITDLDWSAIIVGAPHVPETAAALMAQRSELGLDARVAFRGLVSDEALRDEYRRATVFALATRYEGYGMVLSEALQYGLPIISCHVGAVPDTLPPGAGVLVPPDDPGAFAAALRRILNDGPLRDRLAAVSANEGRALPTWGATAAIMGAALDRVSA